ncbi:lipopolysaccharide heptosyltransferase II [Vibrio tapetis subsp. quintayensis]|uniref:lipopolysaccharide heptosyltransferase II n=1 Tax=Vibrio tapetis TaxID=52443 RepID=UPI0025B4229A|nr:lipopolysaccharide heptosyltransferase II [Vibrio tapetis]MDN3679504.1 lipopolysaccharide heptosyltransferase II [Vibrio tapetis subsp. quintayensis]
MKILVIGPSWVGDMVMSQSLYMALKTQHPQCEIDVLAPAWCKPILERMPEVNHSIEMPVGHGALDLKKRWQIARSLKKNHYTHAIVLPNSAKSALIPFFAGIKQRTGWKGEFRYGLLTDLRPNKRVFQYMVERYVALSAPKEKMLDQVSLSNSPHPKLSINKTSQNAAMQRLNLNNQRKAFGLCPGAEYGPAKRWPDEHYSKVAQQVINDGGQVWLFGSVKDKEVTQKIKLSLPRPLQQHCFDLAGDTSLIEAVDLLAACHTVICNDSGLMHVSAAVNCNIVAIYGSSSPEYTPPLTAKLHMLHTDIVCRPCFKKECPLGHQKCLTELSPQLIIETIKK